MQSIDDVLATWGRLARRELAAIIALFVLAGSVLAFIELTDEVLEGDSHEMDRALMLALRTAADPQVPRGPDWLLRAALDITSLGSTTAVALFCAFTAGLLLISGKRLEAAAVALSISGAAVMMSLLKDVFARSRPDVVPHLVEVFTESFPSGHAMMSAVTYLTLGALGAHAAGGRAAAYILASAVFLTVLIGLSRVYLGVHWPTDVLAGWCAGAAWATACWLALVWLQRRYPRRTG